NADEVVVMNSLTARLHLLMATFYRPSAQRHKILIEANAFPSDRHAVASQIRFHGYDPADSLIEMSPRAGETNIRIEDIEALTQAEGERIALILFPGVNYYSGQAFDCERITKPGTAK